MNNNEEFKDGYKNASGCADPTAYAAIQKADADYTRFHKVLRMIFAICNLAGFWVEGRIVLRDMNTGSSGSDISAKILARFGLEKVGYGPVLFGQKALLFINDKFLAHFFWAIAHF